MAWAEGDTVQFTAVLAHLRHHRPAVESHVVSSRGKHTCLTATAHAVYTEEPYGLKFDRTITHRWDEPMQVYLDCPSTKATLCIRDMLRLPVVHDLLRYRIDVGEDAHQRAATWVDENVGGRRFVIVHYQGDCNPMQKNIPEHVANYLFDFLLGHEITPVVLDWNRRSRHVDGQRILCPGRGDRLWPDPDRGDGETIAALMALASLTVTVDSGPGKIAASSACAGVPNVAVWVGHHPVHYADMDYGNVTHLVPTSHDQHIRGDRRTGREYFEQAYRHRVYYPDVFERQLCQLVAEKLYDVPEQPMATDNTPKLKATSFGVQYYEEHKVAGLDYLGHGEWQVQYGCWIVDSLGLVGQNVLDIGCACGSIALGLTKAGAKVYGIDLSNHMIGLGKEKFPGLPLAVCDAVSMHLYGDATFDFIHANQVAEHWREELVPLILREIFRVTKPGGLFFAVLDTEDLFQRQKRDREREDPTNHCIKPLAWWLDQLAECGWLPAGSEVVERFRGWPGNYFDNYDWDWWLVRKPYVDKTEAK